MIGSAGRGASFAGLQEYLLHGRSGQEHDRVAWVEVRNLPTRDPELAAGLMEATAAGNERVAKPVYHLSLSASPGEELTRQDWHQVADRVLGELGLSDHQALIVAHQDRAHSHVHVMVNRVDLDTGRVWKGEFDYARIEKALRNVEREMGLREVPGHHYRLAGQERPERSRGATSGERRETERTGGPTWQEKTRRQLRPHFQEAKSWGELEAKLRERGLRFEKRGRGLVVTDGERRVKASRIDRGGSIHQLEKRFGISFNEWRQGLAELEKRVAELEARPAKVREVEARREKLYRQEGWVSADLRKAREPLDQDRDLRQRLQEARELLRLELARVYRPQELGRVQERLDTLLGRGEARRVEEILRRSPQQLGTLRGVGVGPLQNAERRQALHLADRAASTLRELQGLHRERATLAGPVKVAQVFVRSHRQTLQGIARRLDELTAGKSEAALRQDITRLAQRLGVEAVRLALPAPAFRVVSMALRAMERVRELGRGMGR